MAELRGILPALVTPFDAAGQFNPAACEQLVDRLYRAGVHGLYVCGTTGEGMLQTVAERKRVTELVLGMTPKGQPENKQVIVHVGAACLNEAIELARHAARFGATAVSSLPPAGPYGFEDIRSYYQALAGATELPLLIYFMPAGGVSFTSIAQILELCAIPNVAGLKFTDHDMYKLSEVKQSGAVVFNGYDEVICAGLLMGADGGIGSFYNLVPGLFLKLYDEARSGQWGEARETQRRINELITLTLRFPLFGALKAIIGWSGIDCGTVRGPRRNLTDGESRELRHRLDEAGFAEILGLTGQNLS